MNKEVITTGRTIDDAINAALEQLGMDRDSVYVEVLEKPKSGFLGIGTTPAKVKVSCELGRVDRAQSFLDGLFDRLGVVTRSEITEGEEGNLNIELFGDNMGVVIGRRGDTLDAIQHITGFVVNRGEESRVRVMVDTENYRKKREESLERLARKTAGKVAKYRRNITLEPMNAYERHVIHTALQDWRDVTTYSTGAEPNRRVVLVYGAGKKAIPGAPSDKVQYPFRRPESRSEESELS